ncbi:MAG: peptide chain release factor N(5)-glutamine methyltransferase [Lachnospiraceae bacterium]|nr:peptide chain release factor N(5)-glutamine methyltransferase [Lachnospiraceae bacterium]
MTYQEIYQQGMEQLMQADIQEAGLDARLLLEWCCGTDRNTLLVHGERSVSPEEYERYRVCIVERKKHVPLQYITGEQDFMGLTFAVNRNVLVPRQDTEILVEEAMRYLHDGMRILDMCTGSGCILISLLHYSNDCTGVGVDLSEEALQVAKENAERILNQKKKTACEALCVPDESEQNVFWVCSNLFERLDSDEKFDIIVSNPPYIRTGVIDTLMPEVKEHEPRLALDGQEDGLFFYREIIARATTYLNREGMLLVEIGYDQGEEVRALMENAGYTEVDVVKDFAGLDRVVHGVYSANRR